MKTANGKKLTPALVRLLDACLLLGTTDARTLANHLNRSTATVRTEFQRILVQMQVHSRFAALKKAEAEGWLTGPKKTDG